MPEPSQHHRAAASSARKRLTARLLRDLRNCRPLTESQRAELIAAAAAIPVCPDYAGGAK